MEINRKTLVSILSLIVIFGFARLAFSQSSGYSVSAPSFVQRSGSVISPVSSNYAFGVGMLVPQNATTSLQAGGSLPTSTTFYYRVTAFDGAGGETLPSVVVSGATLATTTNATIRVSWDAVYGAVKYNVYRSTSSTIFPTSSLATTTTATTFDDATTTLSSGRFPSVNGAYLVRMSTSTASWITGSLGIGTTTPAVSLQVAKTTTTSVAIGAPVTGANIAKLCLWNGASFTQITFAANSATPVYATSTTCNEN